MGHFSRQSCEETDWTRTESLPNRSNPAPETGQPKITSSAGRSPIPGASREVSFRSERQQESSQHLGAVQELLVWNTPRWGRASAPHSAHKQCSDLCNGSQSSPVTHEGFTESPGREDRGRRDSWHQAELPLSSMMPLATAHPWCSHLFLWEVSCTVRHS